MPQSRVVRCFRPLAGVLLFGVLLLAPNSSPGQFGKAKGKLPDFVSADYDDYQNMLDQLGIKKTRKGPDGNSANKATYDPVSANQYKDTIPDLMTFKDGSKVASADQWPKRRAEIVEDFEREVYGRIPKNVPKVKWEVTKTEEGEVGGIATVTKTLVGHVDNSEFPQIKVDIRASFTVPKHAAGRVPIILQFGGGFGGGLVGKGLAKADGKTDAKADAKGDAKGGGGFGGFGGKGGGFGGKGAADPWTVQAIKKGWGYGTIDPSSVQADSGGNGGLRTGIVGLTNKGQPRRPDDWGALRAWAWGVSCLIDYFEQNPDSGVDPTKVCITGVSRYGKAALVTAAFDTRIAAGFIASSGAGGAKLQRHIFGELLENVAGKGEYHWMCGNYIKYAAEEGKWGRKTAADLPVDQHELIALCAPRLCLISTGVQAGDPNWIDARGTLMATVLAGPTYRLLGKKDLGMKPGLPPELLPEVNTLIGGELAWRQHNGGHENATNFPTFFQWAGQYISTPGIAEKK